MRNAIVDQILMERMNRRGGYDGRDYARGCRRYFNEVQKL